MPLEHLAYEEAKRAIDRQSNALDGLRARAGILLAAVSLATSFFGGLALGDEDLSAGQIVFVAVAIPAALAAGGFCVGILWPRATWAFNLSVRVIGPELQGAPDPATAYRYLAVWLEKNYDRNERRLVGRRRGFYRVNERRLLGHRVGLFWLFRWACIALGVETMAWIVVLVL